jgi:hypothetical protein
VAAFSAEGDYMFNPNENPIETIQDISNIMSFINEVLQKIKPEEKISPEAMSGFLLLLEQLQENLSKAGQELTSWRKVSGSARSLSQDILRPRER